MLLLLSQNINQQPPSSNTDAFWEKEIKPSPLNVSTIDNYDEDSGIFFPLEQSSYIPASEKSSGIFRLVGNVLYKVK